jgi:hypothetical protein
MKIDFVLAIFVLTGLFSCENEGNDSFQKDSILVGDNLNMIINNYDTILYRNSFSGDNPSFIQFDIDINNDSTKDFRFIVYDMATLGSVTNNYSEILSLDFNCFIYGITQTDTTFLYTEYINDSEYLYYSCFRISEDDVIFNIILNQPKLIPKYVGEYLYINDSFISDTAYLVGPKYVNIYRVGQMTLNYEYHTFNCKDIPSDEVLYLGIKIKDSISTKLGWIKLCVINEKPIIIGSGIQK